MKWQREVSCTTCGFLYWETIGEFFEPDEDELEMSGIKELYEVDREEMQDRDVEPPYSPYLENEETRGITRLACLRHQWLMLPEGKEWGCYSSIEEVIQKRKCVYYMKYIPGFNPEEHKELQKEKQTRETIFKATLIGAIIGAAAAIIAQVVYSMFNTGN